ncbi:hypothetical protein CKO12_07705 [Chromatium okenii]|uniref:hypothetical protein n=1 Tax=Chromatium okenii TaxID=61644 RepID=UPI001905619C|nr:hypothetical protein [Chromatium okenii]MBK1641756.1 hypothetical protein [Chromatium okenii]
MLTPISVHRLSSLLPTPAVRPVLVAVAPPAAAPVSAIRTADDILDDLANRLEQDLDYQILRQTLNLETDTALRRRRVADTPPPAPTLNTEEIAAASAQRQERTASLTVTFTSGQQRVTEVSVETADPLVLDLSGAGITTSGVDAGVQFDLNGDGQQERVSTAVGDTWLLALDRNGNAQIDDGRELFGDQHGAAHGFAELARYDADASGRADGVIDANDAVFSQLRLLQLSQDGTQRTQTLAEAGVTALELDYHHTRKALNVYDTVAQSGQFQRTDGSHGEAADVLLGYHSLS